MVYAYSDAVPACMDCGRECRGEKSPRRVNMTTFPFSKSFEEDCVQYLRSREWYGTYQDFALWAAWLAARLISINRG